MPEEAGHPPANQELLLALIKALDAKIELLVSTQKEGVKTAMDAAEKAVAKAEHAADKRFEALNELRGMAADWRTEFARQSTVDLQVRSLTDKIDEIRTQMNSLVVKASESVARGSGRSDIWGFIVGGAGLVAVATTVMTSLFHLR